MSKLTGALFGVPAGEVYPRTLHAGDDCPPELEEAARALGVLAADDAAAASAAGGQAAPATKALKAAPENK